MNRGRIAWAAFAAALAFLVLPPGRVAVAADQEGCLLCHRLEIRLPVDGQSASYRVHDPPGWLHEALFCSDCHPDGRMAPHAARPGAAQCIGECHGSSTGAVANHRRASFGGLTESHRGITPDRSPCRHCHDSRDRRGERSSVERRCSGCHSGEHAAVSAGPHGFLRRGGGCAGCHPAHREAQSPDGRGKASCGGPGCHAKTTPAMRALADHGGKGGFRHDFRKALLFALLGGAGWGLGLALSPRRRGKGGLE